MKIRIFCCLVSVLGSAFAEDEGKIVFEDDFSRDGKPIANGWTTNDSKVEQATIIDGSMHIATPADAGHRASVRHNLGFKDGIVSLKILLPNKGDTVTLDYADQMEKTVHAGHLFSVTFSADSTKIEDLKTGRSAKAKSEKKPTAEEKNATRSMKANFQKGLATDEWHLVTITVKGELLSVSIDGEKIGELSSEGFAHATKRMLRIAVPKKAVVDDFKILTFD